MSSAAAAAAATANGAGGGGSSVRLRYYKGSDGASLARITLNRERLLNALDADAVEAFRSHLLAACGAAASPASSAASAGSAAPAAAVVIDGCTPRAFCAGGDVKSARAAVLEAPYEGVPPPGHHIHRVFQVREREMRER